MKLFQCTPGAASAAGAQRMVTLSAAEMPRVRPGQLLLVRLNAALDPYLPAAYFPLPAGMRDGRAPGGAAGAGGARFAPPGLSVIVAPDDPLVRLTADALEGAPLAGAGPTASQALDALGPVGNGFTLDAATRRLLLVCEPAWLAPLLALAHEASEQRIAVSLLVCLADGHAATVGPNHADLAAWLSRMLPLDVEYQLSAQPAAALPSLLGWADQVCAAADGALLALLRHLAARVGRLMPSGARAGRRETRETAGLPAGFVQVIVAPPMACGTGACQGCAVETGHRMQLACVAGPVFDLAEL